MASTQIVEPMSNYLRRIIGCANNINETNDVACVAVFNDEQMAEADRCGNPCNWRCPCYERISDEEWKERQKQIEREIRDEARAG